MNELVGSFVTVVHGGLCGVVVGGGFEKILFNLS